MEIVCLACCVALPLRVTTLGSTRFRTLSVLVAERCSAREERRGGQVSRERGEEGVEEGTEGRLSVQRLRRCPSLLAVISRSTGFAFSRVVYSSLDLARPLLLDHSTSHNLMDTGPHHTTPHHHPPTMLRRKPPTRFPPRLRTLTTQNPQTITSNDHIIRLPKRFGTNFQHDDVDLNKERRIKLERIAHGFRGVRWGMAYGSGVFEQVGYLASSSPAGSSLSQEQQTGKGGTTSDTRGEEEQGPMLDFLLATTHPSHFHAINLSANPTHYPLIWRWLGPHAISRVQEWGGGVWFVTDVHVPLPSTSSSSSTDPNSTSTSTSTATSTVKIKYGIISLDTLCQDLLDWTHLYASGRMHKPIRIVRGGADKRVLVAAQVNLTSALRVALLRLGERFRERELWEEVAGISYSG
jgi:hypothetical protein